MAKMKRAGAAGAAGPGGAGRQQGRRQRRQQQQQQQQGRKPRSGSGRPSKKPVDCKPGELDEQEIPFRLREIMRSRQEMKTPLSQRRRRAAQADLRRSLEKEAEGSAPDIPVPTFKQRKGESDRAFVRRMEQEAQHVMFLSRNQASCQPEAPAAPKEKSEGKREFQRRRLDRKRQRRAEKAAERLEQELLRDPVKFGDIVLQPPELTARPRASTSVSQPGRKSLLLKTCLNPGGAGETQPPSPSPARLRIMEAERERAVLAYRALKQRQQKAALSLQ